ncbi:MAG TPA: hypothetical protein VN974_05425, partial [Candidatus Dormibacteraeota bacterium]|nr:hypothetical protein [Candidatus Dormibacteraeota bacterium]
RVYQRPCQQRNDTRDTNFARDSFHIWILILVCPVPEFGARLNLCVESSQLRSTERPNGHTLHVSMKHNRRKVLQREICAVTWASI